LIFKERLVLYSSSVDIQELIVNARRRCYVGAALAVAGFGTLLSSLAATLPPVASAMFFCGACANCYALGVVLQRVLRSLAVRHVEQITVLPSKASEVSENKHMDKGSLQELLGELATQEDRLAATDELRIELRTATAEHWITLTNPWHPEAMNEESDSNLSASFSDVVRSRIVHVDLDNGECADIALLTAILETSKVAGDERAQWNPDAADPLQAPPDAPAPQLVFSDFTKAELEEATASASEEPPWKSISKLGSRALYGGVSVFVTGGLFALGESARDPDGIARWSNLPRPPQLL
jgi:hypothetical protein